METRRNSAIEQIPAFPKQERTTHIEYLELDELDENQRIVSQKPYVFPACSILLLKNIIVGGLGLLIEDNIPILPQGIFPSYLQDSLTKYFSMSDEDRQTSGARVWFGASLDDKAHVREIETGIFALHPNLVYGHFLTEILPRLLVLHANLPLNVPIITPKSTSSWLNKTIAASMRGRNIATYDHLTEKLHVRNLWSVSAVFNANGFHPRAKDYLTDLSTRLTEEEEKKKHLQQPFNHPCSEDFLYISRTRCGQGWHGINNEIEVQNALSQLGFLIIHPEQHTFPEQVTLFSKARIVVSEFSSAMHNALFSSAGTKVICLNWINNYQTEIARLQGHRIGYIRPRDGVFRDSTWQALGKQLMEFDPLHVAQVIKNEIGKEAP